LTCKDTPYYGQNCDKTIFFAFFYKKSAFFFVGSEKSCTFAPAKAKKQALF
jgi:hypothetical protein